MHTKVWGTLSLRARKQKISFLLGVFWLSPPLFPASFLPPMGQMSQRALNPGKKSVRGSSFWGLRRWKTFVSMAETEEVAGVLRVGVTQGVTTALFFILSHLWGSWSGFWNEAISSPLSVSCFSRRQAVLLLLVSSFQAFYPLPDLG